jgi:hypothetical protein
VHDPGSQGIKSDLHDLLSQSLEQHVFSNLFLLRVLRQCSSKFAADYPTRVDLA